ncbi:MAG: ABC transporter permease, partial [Planctomycetota bacterium]
MMNAFFRAIPLVLKQVVRRRGQTILTAGGIAIAMFLFTAVQAMQQGVSAATEASANERTLVVFRKDRFCPSTSTLPQDYERKIERIEGVVDAIPIKVVVNNCRTSLDVVAFRGVPKTSFLEDRGDAINVISGSVEDWMRRTDAALVGEQLAARRGVRPGDMLSSAGVTVYVAGIISSEDAQDENTAWTALEFVQTASRAGLGSVTQFNVRLDGPDYLDPVAEQIDALFRTAAEPTVTSTEKAFVGRIARDLVELVGFTQWLGIGCLIAVLALVGNAIVLSVQSRVSEHAILQTLGFNSYLIAALVVLEGVILAVIGGGLGALAAVLTTHFGQFAVSVEGQSIGLEADAALLVTGLLICGALGVAAGLV